MRLAYHIDATRPADRRLRVRVRLERTAAECTPGDRVEFFLPTWTPGSYLIREYARQLSRVVATAGDGRSALRCHKTAKNRFEVHADGSEIVELRYEVYAHELSVRTADVEADHAFWNHACVLLWPCGGEELEAHIDVDVPDGWSFATPLRSRAPQETASLGNTQWRRHSLRASNFDEVIDAPCLAGALVRFDWDVDGVPHAIAMHGLASIRPPKTLVDDLTRIIRAAAAVFGKGLPYERYLFLALFAEQGHGGLEHRDSSTLLMARTVLTDGASYREFLGLAAHEIFHAWNGKRMRPVEYWRYDYERENYTDFLWLVEGCTAYYDDLLVARAGSMTATDYLATMARNLQAMLSSPGRFASSLEESSFDAWIRLYRPDEHTRNSSQNYYGNGAVAALCLDLEIRLATGHARSLDDVLRRLYAATYQGDRGYTRIDVERALADVAGEAVVGQLRELIGGNLDPELTRLLTPFGVALTQQDAERPQLGITFADRGTVIAAITDGSAAQAAGLAPGDEVLALQGLRVNADSWASVFRSTARNGEPLDVLFARRGVIGTATALPSAGVGTIQLRLVECADEDVLQRRQSWLGDACGSRTSMPSVPASGATGEATHDRPDATRA